MRAATEILPAQMTVREAVERAPASQFRAWPVVDQTGVLGVVSLTMLEQALRGDAGARRLAELLDAESFPHVHADQALHLALERMGSYGLDVLPAVSRANVRVLVGVVALRGLLGAYGVAAQRG